MRNEHKNSSVGRAQYLRKLIWAALFLALALVLPFLTLQIPQIGAMLCPMHIPVLLCGFICGWPWGLAVGFIAPLLRSTLFGIPIMYPAAISMAFELATYGTLSGILYAVMPKRLGYIYAALILSMLCGRLVWGAAQVILLGLRGIAFTWSAFLAGAVTNAIPGILLHIILVPPLVALAEHQKNH